jgi:transposase
MLLVQVFCGIDRAEDHYDVALVDQAGVVLTERRIDDDAVGYQLLLALLAEHGDDQVEPIPVAIETPRGLVVACLRRTGRQVYAINPLSVARYRERHSVARTKSDRVDAQLLANILRTDRAAHRPLPADSELAGHRRPGARSTRCRLEPPAGRQPTPLPAAGVLPRVSGGVPGP